MTPLSLVKAWILSAVCVLSLTNASFADHHGGGHHHGGGGSGVFFRGGFLGGGFGYPGYSGFGYGGYPYGYGYGYGPGYGYGYGPGLGIGISSAPRYYSTPVYAYPSTAIVGSRPAVSQPTFDNGPIVITNPAANDQPVDYTLNGLRFSIKPGQSQKIIHDRDWIVDFSRGDGKGSAQYALKSATYKFKPTDKGWELFEAANSQPAAGPQSVAEPTPAAPNPAADLTPAEDPTTVVPAIKVPKRAAPPDAPKPADAADVPKPADAESK